MLKNFFKAALRHLRRDKFCSAINIIGLSTGLACCLLIAMWILAELDFDNFHGNAARLYQVLAHGSNPDNPSNPLPLGPALQAELPEVALAVRYDGLHSGVVRNGDRGRYETAIQAVDPEFFQVFSFPFSKGDSATALVDPSTVVISTEVAENLFGDENPLGKVLLINNQGFKVTGVFDPIPERSTVQFNLAVNFRHRILEMEAEGIKPGWGVWSAYTFILANPNVSPDLLNAKIKNFLTKKDPREDATLSVIPFRERRLFFSNIRQYLTLFAAIAAFILIIACINYINLSTARSDRLAKEIGIRKVSGADRGNLIVQFLGESIFLAFLAVLLAYGLAILALPWFNTLATTRIAMDPGRFLPAMAALALLTGLGAGLYPAFFLSAFRPVLVLRGKPAQGLKTGRLRVGLVVFQFGMSILLMIGSAVVTKQLHFMRTKDVGYDKERLLVVSLPGDSRARFGVLKEKLLRDANVRSVTGTTANMVNLNWSSSTGSWEGKNPDLNVLTSNNYVDDDFADTFGIALSSGRFFSRDFPSDRGAFVINESLERLMGNGPAVGKTLTYWKQTGAIIGVLKDFHFQSLQSRIGPLVLMLRPDQANLGYIRLEGGDRAAALSRIRTAWQKILPEYPFQYRFVNESLDAFYRTVQRTGRMADTFTVLAVFIACLGLLGLASFMTDRRAKEIGIRKILGASISSVLMMLTGEIARYVALANLVAWPAAYILMNKWLTQFAYRIPLALGLFALSAASALAIALLTVSVQAIRAAVRNPSDSLRFE